MPPEAAAYVRRRTYEAGPPSTFSKLKTSRTDSYRIIQLQSVFARYDNTPYLSSDSRLPYSSMTSVLG